MKLAPKYYGPFKIIKEVLPIAYKVQLPASWGIHDMFHVSLLLPYHKTISHGPSFSQPPPDLIDGEEEYEVERIVNHCHYGRSQRLQYLIKWKGYPESDNTWELADQVHTPDLIKLYHQHSPLKSIKGRRLWWQGRCPTDLISPLLPGAAKNPGSKPPHLSSPLPLPAPALPLSSSTTPKACHHRPKRSAMYSSSSSAQSSLPPANLFALNTQREFISSFSNSKTSYRSKKPINTPSNTGSTASLTTVPTTAELCQTT